MSQSSYPSYNKHAKKHMYVQKKKKGTKLKQSYSLNPRHIKIYKYVQLFFDFMLRSLIELLNDI